MVLGTAMDLSGVAIITLPDLFNGEVDVLFYLGVICLLLNAVCWAVYSVLSMRIMIRMYNP